MLTILILIIWAHFIGDFIFQTDNVAISKSKSNLVLLEHIALYSIPLTLIGLLVPVSLGWVLVNAVAHFIVDYVTSRTTSYLWQRNERHLFFVVIGLDQALHMICLITSYFYLCLTLG